jgi:hypothetical protein
MSRNKELPQDPSKLNKNDLILQKRLEETKLKGCQMTQEVKY